MIGDGFCDDKYNTMDCNFDGGDCCLENSDGDAVSSEEFCIDCICYDAPKVLSNCLVSEYVNNSVCEDFANVRECAFDGGKAYKKSSSILYIGQQEWQYKIMGLHSLGTDIRNVYTIQFYEPRFSWVWWFCHLKFMKISFVIVEL